MEGRKVKLIEDRDLARKRLPIFAGSDMPSTIVIKELIDNEIDVVNERSQPAKKVKIQLGPQRIKLMDDGPGISTEMDEETGFTNLWLSCAKMFSSSNYDGVSDTVGANGVGLTIANYTSAKFRILAFKDKTVEGYSFTDGFLDGSEESEIESNGDYCKVPYSTEEAKTLYEPFFDKGFLVDVQWHKADSEKSVLWDMDANIGWLKNYTELRVGEMNSGEVIFEIYEDNEFTKLKSSDHWTKNSKDDPNMTYIPSWNEKVKEKGGVILKDGDWQIALFIDKDVKIDSIVQGAPIRTSYNVTQRITIQDLDIKMAVPFSLRYRSEVYPKYQDQTKVTIGRLPYAEIGRAFEKSGSVYRHFYLEAEKAYMAHSIQGSESNTFWPSLGKPEESELIIGEGYSSTSGIKAGRDRRTQACIALRGKITNCWNIDMQKAMRSDIVKQILNEVIYKKYDKIIMAVDADDDGSHIASLLIATLARFTNVIQEGRLYYASTPKYLFKKKGHEIKWSNEAKDCPEGYSTTVLKGLGGMKRNEIKTFITNKETRELIRITWDENEEESIEALNNAFSEGGERWIINEEAI